MADVRYTITLDGNYKQGIETFNKDLDEAFVKSKRLRHEIDEKAKHNSRVNAQSFREDAMRRNAAVRDEINAARMASKEKSKALSDWNKYRDKEESFWARKRSKSGGGGFFSGGISGIMSNPAFAEVTAVGMAVSAVAGLTNKLAEATIKQHAFERSVQLTSKGVWNFGANMAFVDNMSEKYGQGISGLRESFMQFNGATNGTNISGERTRIIFEQITKASSVMGLSSEDTKLALLAVSQMASKGVVSMEELRRQLMERIPISFETLAQKFNMTSAEFNKFVSSGKLMSEDFIPKLGEALDELTKSGKVDELVASINSLDNAQTRLAENAGKVLRPVLTGTYNVLAELFDAKTWVGAADILTLGMTSKSMKHYGGLDPYDKKGEQQKKIAEMETSLVSQKYGIRTQARAGIQGNSEKKKFDETLISSLLKESGLSGIYNSKSLTEGQKTAAISKQIDVERANSTVGYSGKSVTMRVIEMLTQDVKKIESESKQQKLLKSKGGKGVDDDFSGTTVTARTPKTFNVVIQKLVGVENFNAANGDNMAVVGQQIKGELMQALAQVQISAEYM